MQSRILIPIRYAAWLSGDLGMTLTRNLEHALQAIPEARLTRLPRGFLVEAAEDEGPLVEAVHRSVQELEEMVRKAYPVFHREMGPVWTGTLQVLFPDVHAARA